MKRSCQRQTQVLDLPVAALIGDDDDAMAKLSSAGQ